MKVGIMGGTLDPVHNGHLQIAQAVRKACGLDGLVLLPAGDPPHKRRESDKWDRLEMARLAAQNQPEMRVSEIEVLRQGTTYTVDTLNQLNRDFPGVEWVYIIGADTVGVLESWRSFDQVAAKCSFAAVGRPGFDAARARAHAKELETRWGARIIYLEVEGPDISSTDIRNRVAEGRSIAGLAPEAVEAYIRDKGLYLCGMSWSQIDESLRARLKPSRYRHTLGVAQTAFRLAGRYGVDPQRARLAGMLHDCAKWMNYEDMARLVKGAVCDVDAEELATEPVLHAPAGRVLAERDYGVRDPEILSAIRKHTLGGRDMTPLEQLIYVADFIEPGRKPFDGLEEARALAEKDLAAAARLCAKLTSEFVAAGGGTPHPRTADMV